ncbi:MAG: MFS transporter [Actinomycetales bacterium]|nr:MFS transporter [Actinomycetales bacterium]
MLRIHRAWAVAAVTFLVLIAAATFRSSFGVMVVPLESDFGWPRSATSLAVSVNLVVYGLSAPFAAALMERFGVRRIAALSMAFIAIGTGLTIYMQHSWQLVVLWGLVVGLGTGGTALVFGSLIVNRWFVTRRGLVLGIIGTAYATGQLAFLPLISRAIEASSWRAASAIIAGLCLLVIPLIIVVLRDRPSDVGLRPYGATGEASTTEQAANSTGSGWKAAASAITALRQASRTRAFWLLAGTFFICGWTTNGIISTHFVPAAHDHGMGATTAAGLLAIVGVFDIIGTIGSGWLTDRFDPRILLGVYYALRGIALLAVPFILGPDVEPPIIVIMILFGLDWVATVPPTVTLCRQAFGIETGAIVFGWVFASHMIGAGASAAVSGALHEALGDYASAWYLAGALAILAAGACAWIPRAAALPDNPPLAAPDPHATR